MFIPHLDVKLVNGHFCTVLPMSTLDPNEQRKLEWRQDVRTRKPKPSHMRETLDTLAEYAMTKADHQ